MPKNFMQLSSLCNYQYNGRSRVLRLYAINQFYTIMQYAIWDRVYILNMNIESSYANVEICGLGLHMYQSL